MLALGRPIATGLSSVPGVGIELLRGELDVHRLYLIRAQRKQKAVEWRTTRSAQGVVRQVSHHSTSSPRIKISKEFENFYKRNQHGGKSIMEDKPTSFSGLGIV